VTPSYLQSSVAQT